MARPLIEISPAEQDGFMRVIDRNVEPGSLDYGANAETYLLTALEWQMLLSCLDVARQGPTYETFVEDDYAGRD